MEGERGCQREHKSPVSYKGNESHSQRSCPWLSKRTEEEAVWKCVFPRLQCSILVRMRVCARVCVCAVGEQGLWEGNN